MKIYILSALFCFILISVKSQDNFLFNNNQSLLFVNPSFAGSNDAWRMQTSRMSSNPNLSSKLTDNYLAIDKFVKTLKGGLGLIVTSDNFSHGLLKEQSFALTYAPRFSLMDHQIKIVPSFQIAYLQKQLDISGLPFGQQPPFIINSGGTALGYRRNLDFTGGVLVQYQNFTGGLAIKHFTQPDMGVMGPQKLPAALNVHAAYTFKIEEKNLLQIFTLYNNQGNMGNLMLNMNAILNSHVLLGLGANTNNISFINAGYRSNRISANLSYGYTFNKLASTNSQIFILSLAFRKAKEIKKQVESFENW